MIQDFDGCKSYISNQLVKRTQFVVGAKDLPLYQVWIGFEIAVGADINLQVSIIPQISCCAVTESNINQKIAA